MMRVHRATGLLAATLLVGCSARGVTPEVDTPAVHELARLQSMGQLDQARLACATGELVAATESLPEALASAREARAAMLAEGVGDHARSVQRTMHAGDVTTAAARNAVNAGRLADALEKNRQPELAMYVTSWAMDWEAHARELALEPLMAPELDELWSDTQSDLLVEYAALRGASLEPGGRPPEVTERIAEIEREHPEVMDGYAAMLLNVYRDPALTCEGEGS